MKRLLSSITAATILSGSAFAADLSAKKEPAPAPAVSADGFDFAFGLHVMSDYISRGVSQSNEQPSATVYFEPRYNIGDTQLYVGTQLWRTGLPTDPFGELDLYGGVRQTFGKFTADVGAIYYEYPGNRNQYFTNGIPGVPGSGVTFLNPGGGAGPCQGNAAFPGGGFCATTASDPSFVEIYFKPSYNVTDQLTLAGNFFFSPDWNHYSEHGGGGFNSYYLSFLPKYTFGDSGFSISGEIGRQWLGTLFARPNSEFVQNLPGNSFTFPDFWAYNAGVSYTWQNITADLRYYGSSLNKRDCFIVSSDQNATPVGGFTGRSNWCGDRVMATLSVDFTYSKDIKK